MTLPRLSLVLDPANAMSLVRLPLALLVWLRPDDRGFLLTVAALAAVSDWLDGWLGRRTHASLTGTANVGAWLDPACDKVFTASFAVAVAVTYQPAAGVIVLVLARDVAIAALTVVLRMAGGAARFHAHDFRATITGKATTVAQFATIGAVLLAPEWVWPLAWTTAVLGCAAIAERVRLAIGSGPGARWARGERT